MATRVTKSESLRIPLSDVRPDPAQPRKNFDPDQLAQLRASIAKRGQLLPVRVEATVDGTYTLLDGERRWRALKDLAEGEPSSDAFRTLWAIEGEPREGESRLVDQYTANEQHARHTPAEKIGVIAQLRQAGRSDDEIQDLLTMKEGEFRLLSKLARADKWLMRFAEPLKLAAPVIDDATGAPKKGSDGKTKTYTREFPGLPLTHLDQLVTLANKLHAVDQAQAGVTGKAINLALREVVRVAEQAVVEEWAVSRLKAHCSSVADRAAKRYMAGATSTDPKDNATNNGAAHGSAAAGRINAAFGKLEREAQISLLRDLVARLQLSPEELRALQSIARTAVNSPLNGG